MSIRPRGHQQYHMWCSIRTINHSVPRHLSGRPTESRATTPIEHAPGHRWATLGCAESWVAAALIATWAALSVARATMASWGCARAHAALLLSRGGMHSSAPLGAVGQLAALLSATEDAAQRHSRQVTPGQSIFRLRPTRQSLQPPPRLLYIAREPTLLGQCDHCAWSMRPPNLSHDTMTNQGSSFATESAYRPSGAGLPTKTDHNELVFSAKRRASMGLTIPELNVAGCMLKPHRTVISWQINLKICVPAGRQVAGSCYPFGATNHPETASARSS